MTPQRIIHIITLSEWGGAQQVCYDIVTNLKRAGYPVEVACASGGELVDRLRGKGVPVHTVDALKRDFSPLNDLIALFALYRLIRRGRYIIVHCHSTKAGLLGRLAARLAQRPIILFTAHGWAFSEGRAYWKRWLLAQAERLVAKVTTKIICVSKHDRELALQFKVARPDQLVVVHNGIVPHRFLQADGARVRRQLGLEETPVLTFVGRLATPKDPLTLLRAIQSLSRGKLILVGDGPLQSRAERFIRQNGLASRVILTGARMDIPDILAASDVFVLSSRWEGLPLVIIEAMMVGLPVVASRVGGVPELVEDGITGFLVPPGDPEALAEALQRLFKDKELRRRMGEAGREKALRSFTLGRMLRETQAVYEEMLAGCRARRA